MMNRIRSRAANSLQALYASAARFFPSFVCGIALALAVTLALENYSVEALCTGLTVALFASVPVTLAMELRGVSRRKALCAECAVTLLFGVLGGALRYLLTLDAFSAWYRYFAMVLAGYLILCAALSYVLLMERDNEHTLILSVLAAFAYGIALPLLLMALLGVCLLAFQTLIHPLPDLVHELITCLTMIALPVSVFLALLPRRGEDPKRFLRFESVDGLILGLLSAVYMGLLCILLFYVGKIVFTWQMPVGEMNWYASFALLYYLLLWLMPAPKSKNAACRLYARFGGWLLLPVICVQVYGIGVRFVAYGLTTPRYISMVCLALGIFALALTLMRRSLRPVFLASLAAIVVVSFTPLNAIDVPVMEQEARLQRLLKQNDMLDGEFIVPADSLSDETRVRIISCVEYLSGAPAVRRSDFWQTYLAKENVSQLEKALGFAPNASSITRRYSYQCSDDTLRNGLNVSGYAWVVSVGSRSLPGPTLELRVTLPSGEELVYELGDTLNAFVEEHGDVSGDIPLRFELDERCTLVLSSLSVTYQGNTLHRCQIISGVLLVRE